jgi:hypothetical protein
MSGTLVFIGLTLSSWTSDDMVTERIAKPFMAVLKDQLPGKDAILQVGRS